MGFSGSAPENKPAAAPAPAAPAVKKVTAANDDIIAVIAGAVAASTDEVIAVLAAVSAICTEETYIAQIGRLHGGKHWTKYAKVEGATIRNQMF